MNNNNKLEKKNINKNIISIKVNFDSNIHLKYICSKKQKCYQKSNTNSLNLNFLNT